MLDPLLRRLVDPPLDRAGSWLAARGASANVTTVVGLAVGLSCVPLLALEHYWWALAVILVNRLFDGLDGAIARRRGPTPFGGYLDIVCDMLFYASVPLGFALARPDNAVWAALLLASFVATASSFLGRAVMAAQRGERDEGAAGPKAFFYAAGLVEGSETIAAFILFCLFPGSFPWLAAGFAAVCVWTVVGRLAAAANS